MKPIFILLCLLFYSMDVGAQQTSREKEMIDELNYARTKPGEFAKFIDGYIKYYENAYSEKDLAELKKAGKACAEVLKNTKPLTPLTYSDQMYKKAKEHGEKMQELGIIKHSKMGYAENIAIGDHRVRFAIVGLLIDFKVPSKIHRNNILNPSYRNVACREVGKVGARSPVYLQVFK